MVQLKVKSTINYIYLQDPFAASGGFGQANFSLEQLDPLKK